MIVGRRRSNCQLRWKSMLRLVFKSVCMVFSVFFKGLKPVCALPGAPDLVFLVHECTRGFLFQIHHPSSKSTTNLVEEVGTRISNLPAVLLVQPLYTITTRRKHTVHPIRTQANLRPPNVDLHTQTHQLNFWRVILSQCPDHIALEAWLHPFPSRHPSLLFVWKDVM